MNLAALLDRHAARSPDRVALIADVGPEHRRVTFRELHAMAVAVSNQLSADGLRPGDRVLVLEPMSIELYAILLGLFRAGMVAMFVDPGARAQTREACFVEFAPRAFVGRSVAHLLRLVSPGLRRCARSYSTDRATPFTARLSFSPGGTAACPPEDVVDDHPALLTFTSGTTGLPKATLRTHGLLLAQHRALEAALKLRAGEVELTALPIFVLANLASAMTTVLPDANLRKIASFDPAPVISQINRHRPSRAIASPAFFENLLAANAPAPSRIFTGGAPIFPDFVDRWINANPDSEVVAVYGSTEAEPVAHVLPDGWTPAVRARITTGGGLPAGQPVAEVRLGILRDQWGTPVGPFSAQEFNSQLQPRGIIGEIVVAGAHVIPGYVGGRGDLETKFDVDGVRWHRTGDAGYVDDDGSLWLAGRCAARLPGNPCVYPLQVEAAARLHPWVRQAACVEINSIRILAVTPRGRVPEGGIDGLLQALEWAGIARVVVRRRLPVDRRHQAKIDYPRLRAELKR